MESTVKFWNFNSSSFQDNIWSELKNGLWRTYDVSIGIENDCLPLSKITTQRPVFPNIQQIPPGTKWSVTNNRLEEDVYVPNYVKSSLTKLLNWCEDYFSNLKAKRIGVHLSGGLDSGIIICILKTLNIPFVPIGLKSNTFEFRTERRIQEILIQYGQDGRLIDLEKYPFYSNLDRIPPHQIPMPAIKSNSSTEALVRAFVDNGCDIVFSGQGGDSLLVDNISSHSRVSYNIGAEFENPYDYELYYRPAGVKLISFFSLPQIIDQLTTAAIGRSFDPYKLWARKWFKSILPRELFDFHYCADFFGLTIAGLKSAMPSIKLLLEEAYDLSADEHFSPNNTKEFLSQDINSFEQPQYTHFCSLISMAVWYHSINNYE